MFLETLPIEKFWGVGPKTAVIMHKMGILTVNSCVNAPLTI